MLAATADSAVRRKGSNGIELGSRPVPKALANNVSDDVDEREYPVVEEGNVELTSENLNSDRSTFGHMFITFIGAGILGLPYAFSRTGLLGSLIILPSCGAVATYAMMLLVDCKRELERQGKMVRGYGDIGFGVSGRFGSIAVDVMLVITQVAFCCAYLLFIGQNIHTVFPILSKEIITSLCLPGLSILVLIRSIKKLSPFALVADFANIIGILVVISYDVEIFREHEIHMDHTLEHLRYGVLFANVPYFFGISLYCFEGVGVIIPIEESMENRNRFRTVLVFTMSLVTIVYMLFGTLGYVAYGATTREIITLNLGPGIPSTVVKVCLSVGLFFTYPLMMFPVFTIVENTNLVSPRGFCFKNATRVLVTLFSVIIAIGIPNFGDFISLVGAGACAALALVLPAYFHLQLLRDSITRLQVFVDYLIITVGILFGIVGTIDAGSQLFSKMFSTTIPGTSAPITPP